MATANKKLKVCAFILMMLLSLGYAFYMSFMPIKPLPKKHISNTEVHEILSIEEARTAYETQIQYSIQTMLDSWFGEQKAKVSVRAQMDFSQKTQISELLDADNPALARAVGDEVEYAYAKQTLSDSQKSGHIQQLSIAILIDNQIPLSERKRADLTRLVERTAGFDINRGDTLEIIETSFAPTSFFSSSVWSHTLFIFTLIFLFVLFGVLMTKNGMSAEQIEAPPPVLPAFTNPTAYQVVNSAVEGNIKTNALKKAQELLHSKPDETIRLLRSWLYQTEETNE